MVTPIVQTFYKLTGPNEKGVHVLTVYQELSKFKLVLVNSESTTVKFVNHFKLIKMQG